MLTGQQVFDRILTLVPTAIFTIYYDVEQGRESTENSPEDLQIIEMEGCVIVWNAENNFSLPTLEQLEQVSDDDVSVAKELVRKTNRNAQKSKDLTMVALYNFAKGSNPDLTFSDFLDSLEQQQM